MCTAEISLFKNGVEFLKSFSLCFVLFSGELCLQPLMHALSCFVESFLTNAETLDLDVLIFFVGLLKRMEGFQNVRANCYISA